MDRAGDQTDETVLLHVVAATSVPLSPRVLSGKADIGDMNNTPHVPLRRIAEE
jgi:hypothetical protein